MKKSVFQRAAALLLALVTVLTPAAGAITVEEARDLLRESYVDPIDEEILALPTIQEITDALGDPYTYYMTAEEYQRFQDSLSDTAVVGIGVMAGYSKEGLVISGVAPDSPAAQAGLRVGDAIVAVDGTTLEEAGSSEALALLVPGESGTDVQVTVLRDGQTFTATMTRAEVVFPTATGQVVDGHIGWLEVSSFGENTGDYFEQYILEENEQADRWVVDLRGNPGGYGSAVIQALGYFLGNQNVAYLMGRDLRPAAWRPNPFPVEIPPLTDEPMIVLVDGASASASELFAGAVRDYRAALVIGARTYGKGIAQNVFELEDGSLIESVMMIFDYGRSICVTSQVGCNMGCAFCASGLTKKQRDLSSGEMVAQVMYVQQELDERDERLSHIVVMGTGEPFDNYENVMNFLATVNHDRGLAIGARHITISTCGIAPRIREFALEHTQYNLAISLHAPNDELRSQLMPINRAYPLEELMDAIAFYCSSNNRRLTFEYILLRGVNDRPEHVRQLAKLLRGLNAYVNLIPYNAVDEKGFQGVDHDTAMVFYDALMKAGIRCTIRKEHGGDIDAACGQLRVKHLRQAKG